jgi:hypothetical protein
MSLTVVQRFYELAKQQAEAPALGMEYDGAYHDLPWWFVKSKAKHFGLGLLEAGAREGEYFYLSPSRHPFWIYAELGALTMGLQSAPLPASVSPAQLEDLFHQFPPAFFFLEETAFAEWRPLLARQKSLRRILLPTELPSTRQGPEERLTSFRKVFNAGIRSEAKHHAEYRRIRQALDERRTMSPLRVDAEGNVETRPLCYGDVNEVCARLSHALGGGKARAILSAADLSRSFGRIAAVYWPIFAGLQSRFLSPAQDWSAAMRRFRPEAAFLEAEDMEPMGRLYVEAKDGFFARRRLRRKLGKRLRCLFGAAPFPAEFVDSAAAFQVKLLAPQPSAPNFLL